MSQVLRIIPNERGKLAALLEAKASSYAIAAYYALDYPENRVQLFGYFPSADQLTAFLVVAQTGADLFRPLIIPFAHQREAVMALIRHGMNVGQSAILHLPSDQAGWRT